MWEIYRPYTDCLGILSKYPSVIYILTQGSQLYQRINSISLIENISIPELVNLYPLEMPRLRGKSVSTHCFVDAKSAGDKTTRRSMTGTLIFFNKAPIIWHSKRQIGVETSVFGSDFTDIKNSVDLIAALRYNLRVFGVCIEESTDIFCDNEAVFKNESTPKSQIRNKHHGISYHKRRDAVASGAYRVAKEDTDANLSGPVLSTRCNLVPRSAPVAQVHPQTVEHCYFPYLGYYMTPKTMAME